MKYNKNNKSHFSAEHENRKRNIIMIIAIAAGVFASVLGFSSVIENSAAVTNMLMHNHVDLNVTIGGKPIIVPSNIGILQTGIFADPLLYANHDLDKYGMEGMSPLHTHDSSGLIHVESSAVRNYTLGELLDIWRGLNIEGKTVMASVDGKPATDFRNIILSDGAKILLNIMS